MNDDWKEFLLCALIVALALILFLVPLYATFYILGALRAAGRI